MDTDQSTFTVERVKESEGVKTEPKEDWEAGEMDSEKTDHLIDIKQELTMGSIVLQGRVPSGAGLFIMTDADGIDKLNIAEYLGKIKQALTIEPAVLQQQIPPSQTRLPEKTVKDIWLEAIAKKQEAECDKNAAVTSRASLPCIRTTNLLPADLDVTDHQIINRRTAGDGDTDEVITENLVDIKQELTIEPTVLQQGFPPDASFPMTTVRGDGLGSVTVKEESAIDEDAALSLSDSLPQTLDVDSFPAVPDMTEKNTTNSCNDGDDAVDEITEYLVDIKQELNVEPILSQRRLLPDACLVSECDDLMMPHNSPPHTSTDDLLPAELDIFDTYATDTCIDDDRETDEVTTEVDIKQELIVEPTVL